MRVSQTTIYMRRPRPYVHERRPSRRVLDPGTAKENAGAELWEAVGEFVRSLPARRARLTERIRWALLGRTIPRFLYIGWRKRWKPALVDAADRDDLRIVVPVLAAFSIFLYWMIR